MTTRAAEPGSGTGVPSKRKTNVSAFIAVGHSFHRALAESKVRPLTGVTIELAEIT
jgi:hypothetical protein